MGISSHAANTSRVSLIGEFDLATDSALHELLRGQPIGDVIVDMSAVTFFDCSSYRVILAERERIERCGGSLTVAEPSAIVRRLLSIVDPNGSLFGSDRTPHRIERTTHRARVGNLSMAASDGAS